MEPVRSDASVLVCGAGNILMSIAGDKCLVCHGNLFYCIQVNYFRSSLFGLFALKNTFCLLYMYMQPFLVSA